MPKFLIVLLSLGLFLGAGVYAATPASDCTTYCGDTVAYSVPSGSVCYCNPLEGQGLEAITTPIINFIFKLSIVAVPVLITWAAFLLVTSTGDAEKIKNAKKIIIWTIVGFSLVLLSRGASDLLNSIIGTSDTPTGTQTETTTTDTTPPTTDTNSNTTSTTDGPRQPVL